MKEYAARKTSKKWAVAKVKVVDRPAISEVKDSDEVVVREASAEVSHDVISLSKKRFNSETGSAMAAEVMNVDAAMCDQNIASCDSQITEMTAQKAGWTALKTDIAAL